MRSGKVMKRSLSTVHWPRQSGRKLGELRECHPLTLAEALENNEAAEQLEDASQIALYVILGVIGMTVTAAIITCRFKAMSSWIS